MKTAVLSRVSATLTTFLLLTSVAHAKPASVFMLQFGSFESEQEATERLSSLKTKHSGIVGSLQTRVLPVSLPDNLTVYRTQAGPVASRADAQSLCGQLASTGDECYVVESVMTDAMPATTQTAAAAPAAPAATPAPATTNTLPSTASLSGMKDQTLTVASDAKTSIAPPDASIPLSPAPAAAAASASSDMPNVRALTNAPPITARMAPAAATTTTIASAQPATTSIGERPSFWSHLNPFSDNNPKEAPVAKAPAPAPVAAPVTQVAQVEDYPPAPAGAPTTMDDGRPIVALPAVPSQKTAAPASSPMMLPPPPPLDGKSGPIYQQNVAGSNIVPAPTPVSVGSAMPAPAPAVTGTPFASASNETMSRLGKPANAPITSGNGNVSVGEAQRVPLTQSGDSMFMPSGSRVAPPDASTPIYPPGIQPPAPPLASPEAALPPSAPMGKTLWAEVGYFKDATDALAYWDGYRNAHPDFPVVRVRVTQGYMAKQRGSSSVSLRVGPFAKRQSLAYLCRSITDNDNGPRLGCKDVTDLGMSSSQSNVREHQLLGAENARMAIQQSTKIPDNFWIQLGAYPTMMQAENSWADLKKKHGRALPGNEPNITVPAMQSTGTPSYRVRSGPFATEGDALAACNMVKNGGGNCIVSAN